MRKNLLKRTSILLALCLSLSAFGCQKDNKKGSQGTSSQAQMSKQTEKESQASESKTAESSSMPEPSMNNGDTFKPSDFLAPAKDEYIYEYMGLKFKLTDQVLKAISAKTLAMLEEQSPVEKELRYAMLTFSKMTEEQKNAEVEKMGDGYQKWQEGLERLGTIGMFEKDMTDEELSKLTQCDTHQKIGLSTDGKFAYYLSSKKDMKDPLLEAFSKTAIDVIDKKEAPENGFVLSEKSDLENTEAFQPQSGQDLADVVTKDISGQSFKGEEFSKYDLTMVNVFATWCTACINEIPDLVELQKEMKAQNVNVVGIVTDTVESGKENSAAIEKAKLIQEKTKAEYPFLMPDETNFKGRLNGIQALPETFFVDKNGKIVGETYSGSHDFKGWKEIVEKELANLKSEQN